MDLLIRTVLPSNTREVGIEDASNSTEDNKTTCTFYRFDHIYGICLDQTVSSTDYYQNIVLIRGDFECEPLLFNVVTFLDFLSPLESGCLVTDLTMEEKRTLEGLRLASGTSSNYVKMSQKMSSSYSFPVQHSCLCMLRKNDQKISENLHIHKNCFQTLEEIIIKSSIDRSKPDILHFMEEVTSCTQDSLWEKIVKIDELKLKDLQDGSEKLALTEDCILSCIGAFKVQGIKKSLEVNKSIAVVGSMLRSLYEESYLDHFRQTYHDMKCQRDLMRVVISLLLEKAMSDNDFETWILSIFEELCSTISFVTSSCLESVLYALTSELFTGRSSQMNVAEIFFSSVLKFISYDGDEVYDASNTLLMPQKLDLKEIFYNLPSHRFVIISENSRRNILTSILKKKLRIVCKNIPDVKFKLVQRRKLHFISVAIHICKGAIINENYSVLGSFKKHLETHSIFACNHANLRQRYEELSGKKTCIILKRTNIIVTSKPETTARKTFILPLSKHTTILRERQPDFESDMFNYKVTLRTFQKEFQNTISQLLRESLKVKENTPSSKEIRQKSDVVDFQICNVETQLEVYPVSRNCLDYTFEQIVSGVNQHSQDIMRFEMQRFASFSKYNYPDTPSAFEFAKAGWYATGTGKETACFICNVKFSEWRKGLKPIDVHVQLSPECPFINGDDVEAVSVDRVTHQNASEHSSQNTRRDFESITNGVTEINLTETTNSATNLNPHWFSNNQVSAQRNGHYVNGFANVQPSDISSFQTPIHDQTDHLSNAHQSNGYPLYNRSLLSNGEVSVDNPSRSFANSEFIPNSSNCLSQGHSDRHSIIDTGRPYSNNYHHQNNYQFVPFTADLPQQQPLPLNEYYSPPPMSAFGTPKFPAYLALNVRISSYQGFPSHTGQSPRVLAQAGMFYRGYSDRCSCFWCGIGLQNWSMEDDPWVEHARWSPRCQYLIDSKGEEFIALVQESYRQEDPIFPEINDDDVMIADLQSMGFLTESIQSAIKTLRKNGRNVNLQIVANFLLENMFTEPQAQASAVDVTNDKPPSEFENKAQSNIGKVNNVTSNKNEMSQDKINSLDENSKSMYEETTAMKEQLTCKVCMDNSVSVVFLPCGHIVACAVCSVRLSKCPICRKFIREKVKTLMA